MLVSEGIAFYKFAEKKAPEKPVTPPQPIITTTEPTKSKAPEKKEDVWAEIRGMRNADAIISDLESGGIDV